MKAKINRFNAHIKKNWWLYLILLVYIVLIGITIYYHEPWADEAQAWLIARDLGLFQMLFQHLRYIGHPGLWYIILMIPAKLNFPYITLNIISGIIATIGVYVFLRYSPFPKIIKVLFPFSYYIFYQYGVISRSYVLLPLLLFLTAKIYKEKTNKVYLFILFLLLLANVSLHSYLIAGSLFLLYLIDLRKEWPHLNNKLRIKQIKAGVIFAIVMGVLIIQLWPPKDVFRVWTNKGFHYFINTSPIILNNTMTEFMYITLSVLFISLFWFWQRKALSLYLIPALVTLSFFTIILFRRWHGGIMFLIWIFALWISFEKRHVQRIESKLLKTLVILSIILVLCFQIFWSVGAAVNDFKNPYSAGKSIAHYIKDNKLEDKEIYATTYWSVSILPYFDNVIFDNYYYPEKPDHHLWLRWESDVIESKDVILSHAPDLIIVGIHRHYPHELAIKFVGPINYPEVGEVPGYQFEGVFQGNMYIKNGVPEINHFALFRKEESS